MKSRSARGNSTPTWRRTRPSVQLLIAVVLVPVAGLYVIEAFIAPVPLDRIVLRSLPVLPVAIWTLWYEKSRPFEQQPARRRAASRILLLVLVMAFAVAVLGIGLNWLYDPNRVI